MNNNWITSEPNAHPVGLHSGACVDHNSQTERNARSCTRLTTRPTLAASTIKLNHRPALPNHPLLLSLHYPLRLHYPLPPPPPHAACPALTRLITFGSRSVSALLTLIEGISATFALRDSLYNANWKVSSFSIWRVSALMLFYTLTAGNTAFWLLIRPWSIFVWYIHFD